MDLLGAFLFDAMYAFLGDVTPSPSKAPDAVIGVITPELHQGLLSCSNRLGKVVFRQEASKAAITS